MSERISFRSAFSHCCSASWSYALLSAISRGVNASMNDSSELAPWALSLASDCTVANVFFSRCFNSSNGGSCGGLTGEPGPSVGHISSSSHNPLTKVTVRTSLPSIVSGCIVLWCKRLAIPDLVGRANFAPPIETGIHQSASLLQPVWPGRYLLDRTDQRSRRKWLGQVRNT